MKHYEIVLIIHPDYSEKLVELKKEITDFIILKQGKIHRVEDWGRRQLAYPIKKTYKAYYILMNIEILTSEINFLENKFRFNDMIIRNLILTTKNAVTGISPILKSIDDSKNSNVELKK
ncbi:30S ribosomal protein S6 [Buchnera aphidicola (Kurisakia onigurumii)]|uniref:30S ribosomal protein S6 n=1 Tax=Buchnera aphidicola TaxID=9 RepID=UPI0031B6F8FD